MIQEAAELNGSAALCLQEWPALSFVPSIRAKALSIEMPIRHLDTIEFQPVL